jgi:O-antigen ligase
MPVSAMTMAAPYQRLGEDGYAFRTLCVLMTILIAILPLAHVTGMRNALVGMAAAAALFHYRAELWKDNPVLLPCLAWLAFAALSIAWSDYPTVSFRAFRSDLLYPFVLFLISFMLVRSRNGRLALTLGAAVGTVISLTTTFAAAVTPVEPGMESAAPGVLGWLAWKAGEAVDSSTYIAFLAVPLFVVALTSTRASVRWASAAWLVAFAGLGLMSESRTLFVSLCISLPCLLIVFGLLRGRLHVRPVLVAVCVGLVVSAISLELISRLRLPEQQPYDRSAALEMIASDSRPAIWAVYYDLAKRHPWLGVGFGRSVPSRTYDLAQSEDLKRIDRQAFAHAHNVLLSLALQVGLVGLAIWTWLHVRLLSLAVMCARARGEREKAWAAAAIALVLAMLVKNSTNDLMVFGNAILYWTLLGAILGRIWWGGGAESLTLSRLDLAAR